MMNLSNRIIAMLASLKDARPVTMGLMGGVTIALSNLDCADAQVAAANR